MFPTLCVKARQSRSVDKESVSMATTKKPAAKSAKPAKAATKKPATKKTAKPAKAAKSMGAKSTTAKS